MEKNSSTTGMRDMGRTDLLCWSRALSKWKKQLALDINSNTYPNPLQDNPAYSVVKQYFVHVDDTVPQKVNVHKDSPRGVHFRRAGPRQKVYFESNEVQAAIVTCGGLCPGLNTVIRELVCGLHHMYGVKRVLGIEGRKLSNASSFLQMKNCRMNSSREPARDVLFRMQCTCFC